MYQMRFWASVHSNGSAHSEHDHADATVSSMGTCSLHFTSAYPSAPEHANTAYTCFSQVSGVYYVSTPPGSGRLAFRDPRGPRLPFQSQLEVHRVIGWMLHASNETGVDCMLSVVALALATVSYNHNQAISCCFLRG